MATLLTITVLLPLLGALLLFLRPNLDYRVARAWALGFVLATLALTIVLGIAFDPLHASEPQFASTATAADGRVVYGTSWLPVPGGDGIRFALGVDGVSLALVVLTALLMVPSVFASWDPITERASAHYALMLVLATGLLGLFASLDVVMFYVFFEFTLIPLFFLIGLYGGPERRRASVYFFLYTLAGGVLTLLGVILLVVVRWRYSADHLLTFSIPELTSALRALDWPAWAADATTTWRSPQALIFILLFAGFAFKVPLFPFHSWLPLAHVEAPTAGSILLAGVLLKVGAYGLFRFNIAMTPHGAAYWMPCVAALAVVGIIYGALTALAQTDVKRLVAYSSVSHMGFIVLGLMSMTTTGVDGAVIQMINHGVTTGALFACVGVFYHRYHTREMTELGGLWVRLPILAFFMILAALGSAAVPGLNGFVGEFPILTGSFSRNPVTGALAATGMVLGAYYLLHMLHRLIFDPLREPGGSNHDGGGSHGHGSASEHNGHVVPPLGWHEIAGLTPLMILIVGIGVFPGPIFKRISPCTAAIADRFPALTYHPAPFSPATAATAAPLPGVAVIESNEQDRPR